MEGDLEGGGDSVLSLEVIEEVDASGGGLDLGRGNHVNVNR